jgi:hypothetical protein
VLLELEEWASSVAVPSPKEPEHGSRGQCWDPATTGEDRIDWEVSVRDVVSWIVCEVAIVVSY